MRKGKIARIIREKGFGFIKAEGVNGDVFFRSSAVEGGGFDALQEGMEVRSKEPVESPKGRHTELVRLIAGDASVVRGVGTEDRKAAHGAPASEPNRFLNPYNFVRPLDDPTPASDASRLLGRCPPPPHDRYVGATGRIVCSIRTVTDTFIADSHGVIVNQATKHKSYQFLRDHSDCPVIPGSSLRGVLRTVFEAATNSCFNIMDESQRYGAKKGDRNSSRVPVKTRIPQHLRRCTQITSLCPACRTFGWVAGSEGDDERKDIAYRGRVRVADARFSTGDLDGSSGPRTLAILSAPKPDYPWFYLMNGQSGHLPDKLSAREAGYGNPDNWIRGRKLYWFHERAVATSEEKSDQNRTIRDWLKTGAEARFRVDFENLAEVELGALLWSLELEEGKVHRIGYGKPLGYGCVQVELKRVEVRSQDPYIPMTQVQRWPWLSDRAITNAIKAFRSALLELHSGTGARSFADLRNIADLLAVLEASSFGGPDGDSVSCRYPPGLKNVDRGYEWFQENEGNHQLAMPVASDPDPTLPEDPR